MYKSVYPESIRRIAESIKDTLIPPKAFPLREEREFRSAYAKRFLPHRRATLLIALLTWLMFGYWDWVNYKSQVWVYTQQIFLINTALRLVGLITIIACLFRFWSLNIYDEKEATFLLLGTATLCSLTIIGMLFVVPEPINYQYYFFGLILIIIFTFNLLYLFSKILILQSILIAVFLFLTNYIYSYFGEILTITAFSYYCSFCFFGISHAVRFEVSERERFKQERHLKLQRLIAFRKHQQAEVANARATQEANIAQLERKQHIEKMTSIAHERERFIRAAYHDTMQPLAVINSQIMRLKLNTNLSIAININEELAEIERAGKDISDIMEGIYNLFKWGVHEPKLEVIFIREFLIEIEKRFSYSVKSKNLQFQVRHSNTHNLCGKSDAAMLKRIIENLISNAIKYTQKGGILMGAVNLRDRIRIDIWDTGIGITPEQLSKIFVEFYQVNDQSQGIGLGLPIVRLLVERLPGHALSYASRVDHGSRFSVTLPRMEAHSIYDEQSLKIDKLISLKGIYVILVEDDRKVLNGLQALLQSAGCIVRIATNLRELNQITEEAPDRAPDIIISDYRLRDGETGADVASHIEHCFDWVRVPIVFYSADLDIPKEILEKPFRYVERKGTTLDSLLAKVYGVVRKTCGR